ncbi:MIP family channel protein [Streptomyces sp. JJ36]|uniref:MIP family channel protein n=1 Tax=Streptomyces sp. JJ36 TaxID=2736645 RepID=UPI001F01ACA7|nr:MIP family channel protein [Streptomyces sp. JJ36]MCF6523189.1 MIP family channel protein [Streptomyces sp. JJ36]
MRAETLTVTEPRPLVAECLGTLLLVFFGVGAAVVAGEYVGSLGIALAFGLTLLALSYTLGALSGCHVNPAVTLGMFLARRIDLPTAVRYWVAQVVGGILGALLLFLVVIQIPGLETDEKFGTNGFGDRSAVGINTFGALLAEIVLTFLLVYVLLSVTHRVAVLGFDGLPYGMAYAAVHLVGIPLTGTSVNPARSLGPALFAGGAALTQLWLFLVAPLIGGALAAVVHRFTHPADEVGHRPGRLPGDE